jgi:class 3 adenylate cyclase/pimeloyl-ACP methyl ester carboxylesterase
MEPRIQYVKTTDGVNIAFYAIGHGPATVYMAPVSAGHLQFEWQIADMRRMYERAARHNTYVRLDPRGFGLSDRNVTDFSVDAMMRDLEAVADRLQLDRFRLIASWSATPIAIAYASQHPDRVSHLVLWCGYARAEDTVWPTRIEALRGLIETDWEFASEAITLGLAGMSDQEPSHEFAELFRQAVTPETLLLYWRQQVQWDVTSLLHTLAVPTLVAHRRGYPFIGVEVVRNLATSIPNARFVLLEGKSIMMGPEVNAVIGAFFREGEEAAVAPELPEGMAVLLFGDIAESTALTEQLGDAAFRAKARELDTSLRSVIRESGGTPVEGKVLGDGVLAVFTSARQAIDCALRCEAAGEPLGLRLHLGIHAGDVIREGNNVYGGAVNIAARIAAASAPGEVLVSQTVRDLARTSAGVTFDDRGEHELKGVGEPQRLFAVRGGG